MTTAAQEASQLDSVTDRFQESEINAIKAQQAFSSLTAPSSSQQAASQQQQVAVSKEDVALIVNELEVTEEVATRALRSVEGNVAEALRQLVTSTNWKIRYLEK